MYTGRKISSSLSYVRVSGEVTVGRARQEQDSLRPVTSPVLIPWLPGPKCVRLQRTTKLEDILRQVVLRYGC